MNETLNKIGDRVCVTVETILDFGVFVRLNDGTRGYIRRRNLSLSGEVHPAKNVSKGQVIEVEIIRTAEDEHILELSLKATFQDPWDSPEHQFDQGDIVRGRVKRITKNGVVVEIVPGLDGFVHQSELGPWEISHIEELLWINDIVEAMVIQVNRANKILRLSIKQRILNLSKAEALLDYIQKSQNDPQDSEGIKTISEDTSASVSDEQVLSVSLSNPILIVEDSNRVRQSLIKWFENIDCISVGVGTCSEAYEFVKARDFDVILVDIDLPDGNGIQLIQDIREIGIETPVAIMSGAEAIEQLFPELSSLKVSAVFPKPINSEDVLLYLSYLSLGNVPILTDTSLQQGDDETFQPFRKLSRSLLTNRPFTERLQQVLETLAEQSRATAGILFHMNAQDNSIDVVSMVGDGEIHEQALPGLIASPVRDVIVDRNVVWENHVTRGNWGRFKNLLDFLRFESCIGVPVEAALRCEHALFLFHPQAEAFSRYRIRDTVASASLISIALESSYLNQRAISLNSILLSGQLSAAFSHEVYNKVQVLDYQFKNLKIDFEKISSNSCQEVKEDQINQYDLSLNDAIETVNGLVETVTGFRRLIDTKEELTEISVNTIVQMAKREIQPLANKQEIDITLDLDEDLPGAYGSQFGLYRVLLNLMLNAIQHMAMKSADYHRLVVKTAWAQESSTQEITISISDTGPGIHHKLLDKIFRLGFTTRDEGSGLGLYIGNSLIESFGGKLSVKESIIPLGTEFVIELQRATLVTERGVSHE